MIGAFVSTMEYHSETARELDAIWRSGLANYITTQSEFSRVLQDIQQRRFGRMQALAELGPAFASKLLAARSPSDIFAAWQEWATRWFTVTAENYRQLISESREMDELETRFLPAPEAADE
jgi:hypothetical protein